MNAPQKDTYDKCDTPATKLAVSLCKWFADEGIGPDDACVTLAMAVGRFLSTDYLQKGCAISDVREGLSLWSNIMWAEGLACVTSMQRDAGETAH